LEGVIKGPIDAVGIALDPHRLGIQAFEPGVSKVRLKIHPLVCTASTPDFDGDQRPSTFRSLPEATIAKASNLMVSANNLLSPAQAEGPQ